MEYTKEQELYLLYEHLLSNAKEIQSDPVLLDFKEDAIQQLKEFEEEYPEIVAEYHFNTKINLNISTNN